MVPARQPTRSAATCSRACVARRAAVARGGAVAALPGALASARCVGGLAGSPAGSLDDGLMRVADFVMVLPAIYVVLALRGVAAARPHRPRRCSGRMARARPGRLAVAARGVRAIVAGRARQGVRRSCARARREPCAVICYGTCCRRPRVPRWSRRRCSCRRSSWPKRRCRSSVLDFLALRRAGE